jgi:hypothetical protein
MPDIEQRLKALEKHARANHERWQMLDEHVKALALIRQAIAAPICAATPKILQTIIGNLKVCEKEARAVNAHAKMIVEFRAARKFFEALANKGKGNPPISDGELRRRK